MISTVIFRSTVVVLCDLAAVTAGAWILWNSSATSVVSGPVEDKLLFVLVVALCLSVRHTVSRRTDPLLVKTRVARVTLVAELLFAAVLMVVWQLTEVYYLGWVSTFAFVFFVIGTTFQFIVDVVSSRNRGVGLRAGAKRSRPKSTVSTRAEMKSAFATELMRLAGGVVAIGCLAFLSPVHGWSLAFMNPLALSISFAIGLSIVPVLLSYTGVITWSSLAEDLNFSTEEREQRKRELGTQKRLEQVEPGLRNKGRHDQPERAHEHTQTFSRS